MVPARSDTKRAVQLQKMYGWRLDFFPEVEDFYTSYEVKTKAPVTAKLICVFVFAYAKSRFSHDQANLVF